MPKATELESWPTDVPWVWEAGERATSDVGGGKGLLWCGCGDGEMHKAIINRTVNISFLLLDMG